MGQAQGLQRRLLCGVTVLVPVRFLHLVKKRASERDAVFLNVTATAVSGEARDMEKAQPRGGGGGQRVPLWPLPGRGLWDTAGGRGRGHTCAQPPDGAPAQSPGLRRPPVLSGLSAAVPARWGPGGHGEGGGRSTMGSPCVPHRVPGSPSPITAGILCASASQVRSGCCPGTPASASAGAAAPRPRGRARDPRHARVLHQWPVQAPGLRLQTVPAHPRHTACDRGRC